MTVLRVPSFRFRRLALPCSDARRLLARLAFWTSVAAACRAACRRISIKVLWILLDSSVKISFPCCVSLQIVVCFFFFIVNWLQTDLLNYGCTSYIDCQVICNQTFYGLSSLTSDVLSGPQICSGNPSRSAVIFEIFRFVHLAVIEILFLPH